MRRIIILFIINLSWSRGAWGNSEKLRLLSSWKSLDFMFPNANIRQQAIDSGEFIPNSSIPIDFGIVPDSDSRVDKILITIPRLLLGVPVTLGYITGKVSNADNPLIEPYPNWEMNKLDHDCNHIVSVFRIVIDKCNRLWVLDTGIFVNDRICPPKLLVFNISDDHLISTYEFPSDQYYNNSQFIMPIVDIRYGQCDRAFVYIADVRRYQLIVYNHRRKTSWSIQNELFDAEEEYSNFTINNESFTLRDGIFAMTLSPLCNGERFLFFHSLASVSENRVPTSVIQNSEFLKRNPHASRSSFRRFPYKRSSQSSAEIMDERGILFYPLLSQTALACWNTRVYKEFNENSVVIVAQNAETLQFPSSMKIHSDEKQHDQLWLLTVRFQKVMAGTLNPNETNFRLYSGYVDELIRGTKCDSRMHSSCYNLNDEKVVPIP